MSLTVPTVAMNTSASGATSRTISVVARPWRSPSALLIEPSALHSPLSVLSMAEHVAVGHASAAGPVRPAFHCAVVKKSMIPMRTPAPRMPASCQAVAFIPATASVTVVP